MDSFKTIIESPVGKVGRTGIKDADEYITATPALRAEFKKMVKKLGGKTVALKLLKEMNFGKTIKEDAEYLSEDASSDVLKFLIKIDKEYNKFSQEAKKLGEKFEKETSKYSSILNSIANFDASQSDITKAIHYYQKQTKK